MQTKVTKSGDFSGKRGSNSYTYPHIISRYIFLELYSRLIAHRFGRYTRKWKIVVCREFDRCLVPILKNQVDYLVLQLLDTIKH